jgi:hypothetical protein
MNKLAGIIASEVGDDLRTMYFSFTTWVEHYQTTHILPYSSLFITLDKVLVQESSFSGEKFEW